MIRRFVLASLCGGSTLLAASSGPAPAGFSPGKPLTSHARVVIVQNPQATGAFDPHTNVVHQMVARGITQLTGKVSVADAWRSLVSTQDIVGIKVYSAPGPISGTRPAVVAAVVEGLLSAGMLPTHIVVWDRQLKDLRRAGFFALADRYGIRAAASTAAGYDEKVFYDTPLLGQLVWGDLEFGRKAPGLGRKSFVSKLLTRPATRIINVTPMLNHNLVGVTGNLYGLAMGSIDNTLRFEYEATRLATAVPEIYALPCLSDHVVLNIVDALIAQYEGGNRGLLHYSAVLNQLRFSTDPVALDVLSIQELNRQRKLANVPEVRTNLDLYQNAALLELGVSNATNIDVEMAP